MRLFLFAFIAIAVAFSGQFAGPCREEILGRKVDCSENFAGRIIGFDTFFLGEGEVVGWNEYLHLSCELNYGE